MDATSMALIGGILVAWLVAGAATFKRPILGTAVAGALGSLASLYLARQHANPGGSICNIDETFNCDLVNTSEYAEIGGIPIAVLGAAFYIAVTAVAAMALSDEEKYPNASVLVTLASIPAVVYGVFLAWASSQIGAWCLFCISTYGFSLILLVSGVLGARQGGGFGERIGSTLAGSKDRSMATLVLGGLGAFAVGMALWGGEGTPAAEEADITELYSKPEGEVRLNGDEPIYGKVDAPITVLEYADFECPHCGAVAPQVKALAQKYPNDVRLIFRNYPLDQACNANVGPMHPNSCHAARAAVCAQDQGRFWELNAKMFANQSHLAVGDILFMASELGIDPNALGECMNSEPAYGRVARDVLDGQTAGIHGTPSIFLKGIHPSGWVFNEMGVEGANLLIQAALSGQELPPPPPPKDH
jgi:protein-disulfide isomerase/uncharacterized membrane protein